MANKQTQQVSPSPVEGMMHVMRGVLMQLSGLAGILAFLAQMWSRTSLDQSLYTGVIVGGGVYIILLLVDVMFQRIIAAHVESERERARARAQEREGDDEEATEVPAQETSSKNATAPSDEDADPAARQEGQSPQAIPAESTASAPTDQEAAAA